MEKWEPWCIASGKIKATVENSMMIPQKVKRGIAI